jgi:uncharacterized cupin superfamily protein
VLEVSTVASYPPASAALVPRFHPEQHESFRVLEGAMRVAIGGAERTLAAGETLVARPSPAVQRVLFAILTPVARLLGRGAVAPG